MRAFYDLKSSPPTYDFFSFLVSADVFRKERGAEDLEIVIVPGPKDGFRDDCLPPFGREARKRMLENVVVQGCRLLPSVSAVRVCDDRGEALSFRDGDRFPEQYMDGESHYGTERWVQAMRSPHFDGLKADRWTIVSDRTVTITLREASYWPGRNSKVGEWLKMARWLEGEGWNPVFVRDHEATETIEGFESLFGIGICDRMALYEAAEMNLFVSNGPAVLAYLNPQVRYMVCNLESDEAWGRGFWRSCGVDDQMPNAGPRQRLAWHEDKFELIRDSFIEVMGG